MKFRNLMNLKNFNAANFSSRIFRFYSGWCNLMKIKNKNKVRKFPWKTRFSPEAGLIFNLRRHTWKRLTFDGLYFILIRISSKDQRYLTQHPVMGILLATSGDRLLWRQIMKLFLAFIYVFIVLIYSLAPKRLSIKFTNLRRNFSTVVFFLFLLFVHWR